VLVRLAEVEEPEAVVGERCRDTRETYEELPRAGRVGPLRGVDGDRPLLLRRCRVAERREIAGDDDERGERARREEERELDGVLAPREVEEEEDEREEDEVNGRVLRQERRARGRDRNRSTRGASPGATDEPEERPCPGRRGSDVGLDEERVSEDERLGADRDDREQPGRLTPQLACPDVSAPEEGEKEDDERSLATLRIVCDGSRFWYRNRRVSSGRWERRSTGGWIVPSRRSAFSARPETSLTSGGLSGLRS